MAAVEENKRRAVQLCAQARNIRTQARVLAEATAATGNQIAATIDRLADQRPYHAERYHGGDLLVIGERDRIAGQLQDTIVRRVFAAGLTLQSAAGLTAEPEVRWRIEAAVDELDQVIREIRTVVFQDVQYRQGRTLGQDIADFGGQLGTTASIRVSDPAGRAIPARDSDRLLVILRQLLGLIGEHATPTTVDITADTSSYSLTIEAVPLSAGASAAEPASWFSSVQTIAAQAGVGLAIEPVPGGTRFTGQLPVGLGR